MMTKTEAYNRGLASGKRAAKNNIRQRIEATFRSWKAEFPRAAFESVSRRPPDPHFL
jgi:hypothetical protein